MESKEETLITSLPHFIIKKILSANISPNMVKKLKKQNTLNTNKKEKTCRLSPKNENVLQSKNKSIASQNIKQIQRHKNCRTITLFYRRNGKRISKLQCPRGKKNNILEK